MAVVTRHETYCDVCGAPAESKRPTFEPDRSNRDDWRTKHGIMWAMELKPDGKKRRWWWPGIGESSRSYGIRPVEMDLCERHKKAIEEALSI